MKSQSREVEMYLVGYENYSDNEIVRFGPAFEVDDDGEVTNCATGVTLHRRLVFDDVIADNDDVKNFYQRYTLSLVRGTSSM